jgi:hypothetical protein
MVKKIALLSAGVVLSAFLVSRPFSQRLCGGFLPPNDMKISVGSAQDKGITKEQFDAVLDRIEKIYEPIIAAQGAKLEIARLWEDDTVNAYASRQDNRYIISMFGGLARHKAVTQDGFALVACHELGHHLGGAPKKPGRWASNEGQADYYANLKCLHRIFGDSGSAPFSRLAEVDPLAEAACRGSFAAAQDRALCLRAAMGGLSVSTLLNGTSSKPLRFDTPDKAVVAQTYHAHPAAQCRLDTYFQGSLCARPVEEGLNDADPIPGTCARSRGDSVGIRPRCWFKPPPSEDFLQSTAFLSLGNGGPWQGAR